MSRDNELPFCVFLDTEVYRGASFDWTRPNFVSLRERVRKGSIELVTTDIVVREIRNGIRSLVNEFDQHVQKSARQAAVVRCLGDDRIAAIHELAKNKLTHDRIWKSADTFLAELSTTLLRMPETAFQDMFDLYFAGEPPFGSKQEKCEFPDAANLLPVLWASRYM